MNFEMVYTLIFFISITWHSPTQGKSLRSEKIADENNRRLENSFNLFKSYANAKVKPRQYAKKLKYHGVEEYLSPQQKMMYSKRYGKDTTDVMFKDTWSGFDKRSLEASSFDYESISSTDDDSVNDGSSNDVPGFTTDDNNSVSLQDDVFNGGGDDNSVDVKNDDCVVISISALPRKLVERMTKLIMPTMNAYLCSTSYIIIGLVAIVSMFVSILLRYRRRKIVMMTELSCSC